MSLAAAKPREVDGHLLRVIKDPAAPLSFSEHVAPPDTLPGRVGIIEALRTLVGAVRLGADFHLEERYRRGEIYRSQTAENPAVLVWNADEVHKILRNEEGAWSAGLGWDALLIGRVSEHDRNSGGLLSLDFERHRDARKKVQAAFTPKAIKGYLEIAQPPIDAAVARWAAQRRVAFKPAVRKLLGDVANEIFTGFESRARRGEVDRALTDCWGGLVALSSRPWLSPAIRRARRGFRYLMTEFEAEMPRRREQPGRDLLSQLALTGDASGKDDAALTGILVSLMFGAYDTTSLVVSSMAYLLAKFPAWQERLRAEAQRMDAHDWAALQQMEQLDWVWKEALRLFPTTGAVPRRALRDLELQGHKLRAGTFVWAMNGPQGRDPRLWTNALTFDPERFSPARAQELPRHLPSPFGGGPHACIGMQLAAYETRLLFHGLLTRTRFTLVRDVGLRHTFNPLGCVQGNVELSLTATA